MFVMIITSNRNGRWMLNGESVGRASPKVQKRYCYGGKRQTQLLMQLATECATRETWPRSGEEHIRDLLVQMNSGEILSEHCLIYNTNILL
jgi:hypothetical protein